MQTGKWSEGAIGGVGEADCLPMDPRRIASTAAVVGGVGWLLKVVLIWLGGGDIGGPLVAAMSVLGLAALAIALSGGGYTLVERAPVWLRAVVTVATPLLVLMVWQLLDQAIKAVYPGDSWFRDELSTVVAAVAALGLGVWGFGRRRPEAAQRAPRHAPPARGRRAAR